MIASRCAKAPLGVAHRYAPSRVSKIGLMQSVLRWVRSHSRRRFPVVGTPYAPPTARPCACRGTWALVRRFALCSGQWPAASHWCVPPPTLMLRRCAASALRAGLPVRPPRGLPHPARLSLNFATRFVARSARHTGATGLTACKPAWPLAYFSRHQPARGAGLPFPIITTKTMANYSCV